MRASMTAVWLGAALVTSCGIIAGVDRGAIPGGAGGGPMSGAGGGLAICDPNSCPGEDTDCRVRACDQNGVCSFDALAPSVPCTDADNPSAALCNGMGDCVECVAHADCVANTETCVGGECVAATCSDTVRNQNESDVDCGGICPGCAMGMGCNVPADCASGNCDTSAGGGGSGGSAGAGGSGGGGGLGGSGGGGTLPPAAGVCV